MSTKKPGLADEKDLYSLLGVPDTASFEEIKSAYIKRVREFPPEKEPERFKQIRRAYEVLFNPRARAEYDSRKQHGPAILNLFNLATRHYESENYDAAITCLKRILILSPEHDTARDLMGRCFLDKKNYSEAIECFKILIAKNSTNGAFFFKLGIAYLGAERYPEAEKVLLQATRLSPFDNNILSVLADAYTAQNKYTEAVLSLERAIHMDGKIDFSDLVYFFKMMEIYILSGDKDKIEHLIDKIDDVSPPDANSKKHLAFQYASFASKLAEAKLFGLSAQIMGKALQYDPANAQYKALYKRIEVLNPAVYTLRVTRPEGIWEDSLFLEEVMRMTKNTRQAAIEFLIKNSTFAFEKLTLEKANICFNRLAKYPLDLCIQHSGFQKNERSFKGLPKSRGYSKEFIVIPCAKCQTNNRVMKEKRSEAFCSKCGVSLGLEKDSVNPEDKEIVDWYLYFQPSRIKDEDFCKILASVTTWDLGRVKSFLKENHYIKAEKITRARANEIWKMFEIYSVEMRIVPHGRHYRPKAASPVDAIKRKGGGVKNSSGGWLWVILIVGLMLSSLLSSSDSSSRSTKSSRTQGNSVSRSNDGKTITYETAVNQLYESLESLRSIDLAFSNLDAIKERFKDFENKKSQLKKTLVPFELWGEGHLQMMNGAGIIQEAYRGILERLSYPSSISAPDPNELNEMLKRGDLLLNQGLKELISRQENRQ